MFPLRTPRKTLLLIIGALAVVLVSVLPAFAGYATFSASYGGKTCNGYGATGAPPGYAYSSTDATSASGLLLSQCLRGLSYVEYCDDWGCFFRYPGYANSYMYDQVNTAYSSHAEHVLAVPIDGSSWYYNSLCTASWGSGSTSCP